MKLKYWRRKNLLRGLILGFAVAATFASTAQATNQTYTPSAMRALALRSEAMNQRYQSIGVDRGLEIRSESLNKLYQAQALGLRPDDRAGVRGVESTPVASDLSEIQRHVRADQIGSQSVSRPDDKAGVHGPGAVQIRTPELVATSGDGFNWHDASIGAGTAIGIGLVLMSGLVVSRRRQSGLAV